MIKPEAEGSFSGLATINSQRLYGCQSNVVYGRSQLLDGITSDGTTFFFVLLCFTRSFNLAIFPIVGLPPLVLRRILEILTYLATNHSAVANILFYFDPLLVPDSFSPKYSETKKDKGKEKIVEGASSNPLGNSQKGDVPLILFLKLLNRPLFLRSIAHLEQVNVNSTVLCSLPCKISSAMLLHLYNYLCCRSWV